MRAFKNHAPRRIGQGSASVDRKPLLSTTLGLGLLAGSGLVWAQSAVDTSLNELQQLPPLEVDAEALPDADDPTSGYTVDSSRGATKTDTPLIRTPQTIDVVTRQQLEDQGANTINNALKYTPGVFTGLSGSSSRQTVVALRGFPGGDVNNTFLDGLRLQNDPGSYTNIQIDPFFLERLDVVKGPSSVLYGRAQPGGLVNYVSKKPRDQQQGLLRLYGGSFDTYGAGFDVTGPLSSEGLGSYRVLGSAETSNTQYDVVERERYTVMPQVSFNLSDDTALLLQAYLQRDPEGGFHGSVPYDISVSGSRFGRTVDDSWVDAAEDFEAFDRDTNMVAYQLTHQAGDSVTLRSKARYSEVDTYLEQVYQNGFLPDANPPSTLQRFYSRAREDLTGFSTDNNAQIDFVTGPVAHRLLIGLDYQQRKNDAQYAGGFSATSLNPFDPDYSGNPILDDSSLLPANRRETRQVGAYVQNQMQWNRWHLVLGGRQDYLEREYTNGTTGSRVDRNDDAFSGRAALLYESSWGMSPYVSYSEAFNPSAYSPAGDDVAAPVESHQYEVGMKYQPPGLDALFTLALYDLTQENVQQRFAVTPPTFTGVGDVQSRGIELSARADLTDRLHLSAAYTNSDVEYQDDFPQNGIEAGNTFVRTPDEMASLWLAYDFPRGIRAGVGGRYVGESFANSANTTEVPDYALADAFVSFGLGQLTRTLDGASVKVNANNLFDKEHIAACFSETNCYYGSARTVTATLDYRF